MTQEQPQEGDNEQWETWKKKRKVTFASFIVVGIIIGISNIIIQI